MTDASGHAQFTASGIIPVFRVTSTRDQASPSVSWVRSIAPGQTLAWWWADTAVLPAPLSPGVSYSWTIVPEGGSDPDMTNNTASILTVIREEAEAIPFTDTTVLMLLGLALAIVGAGFIRSS